MAVAARPGAAPSGRSGLLRGVVRLLLGAVVAAALAVALLVGWLWATTSLPPAAAVQPPQQTVLRFADGAELARVGEHRREPVPLEQVSTAARHAVLAAEDRGYDEGAGVSPTGVLRAAWTNLRTGELRQGGSTITQQYARAAFLTPERTWERKLREVVLAVKLHRERGREAVLADYLNTVYFGRGAYGVETAAHTFFGKPAAELTAAEGAVLAAQLRSPSAYDPALAPEQARERWRYVLSGMAEQGWLEQPVDAVAYPQVLPPPARRDRLAGPTGHLVEHALTELASLGFSEETIRTGGLVVETTFDRRAQAEAVRAVQSTLPAELPDGVYAALVSVEPGTGRVRAEYGGADYLRRPLNAATQGAAQAGSSFKPYVLAAALQRDIPLDARLDGSSPRRFEAGFRIRNFGGASYGPVDVLTATAKSVNTAYVELAERAGPERVARTAAALGIRADMSRERTSPMIALGVTTVTPLEQAVAFATLAAGGVRAEPYVVERVVGPDGTVYHQAAPRTERVLEEAVATDVTFALQQVVRAGTGKAARPGRPAAGKTGTTSGNTAAWFVGYVPQLATAVAVYSERQDLPLRGFAGVREVTGGSLPARVWGRYTRAALAGTAVEQFPEPARVGPPPAPPAPPPSLEPLPPRDDAGPRELPPLEPGAPADVQAAG